MKGKRAAAMLATGVLAAIWTSTPAHAQTGDTAHCEALAGDKSWGADQVTSRWVGASPTTALPSYCEVSATLVPVAGSNIRVVYRLPVNWNGKLLGLGGGGWAGNLTLAAASEGLGRGYATAQTDGGHPTTDPWDTRWATSPEAVTDFAYRAINRMTVAGKALVRHYYGRPQQRAYFQGCSTGGRMALMEAQRFPEDYDGIIAGAPVYSLQVQTSAILRNNGLARGGGISEPQLKLVNDSVLKACDAQDGLKDGIVANPRACRWQPAQLACKPGKSGVACLSAAQVKALDSMYAGIRAPDGSWAQFPLSRGGELGWSRFINIAGTGNNDANGGGMPGLAHLLFGDRTVDFGRLSASKDVPQARASRFAKSYEATNPDLSRFFSHGGKLILWHGESDPGPSPVGTLDYARAAMARNGTGSEGMRTYLLPGVEHCRGGPGADKVDWLDALDRWVDKGAAPATLTSTRADGAMTRPICKWPQIALHSGSGEANDPTSWSCVRAK